MAQTKPKAAQFYGVSDNGTDGQFLKTDGTGGMSWASTIVNPTITSIDYPGSATAADPAGGESVIINGTLFASGITCTVGGTSAVTAFNSATQITITTPAKAAGQYTVAVTNTDGGNASQANFIQYSGVPVWSTASGNIGSVQEGETASFQVTATEGSDTIEYSVTTGTLPTGLSLNTNTGAITGTAPSVSASTTTTFSITATDDENQTSSARSFNITVTPDLPSNHFTPIIWTGNSSSRSITSLNFSPDLVWIKDRDNSRNHCLFDTVRGPATNLNIIYSDIANAQDTNVGSGFLSDTTSNGFNLGNSDYVNGSGNDYVAWSLKAGGTAVTNSVGTMNSQVSANNTLGFSIASYTSTGTNGATFGHGLDAAPELVLLKCTSTGSTNWIVGGTTVGNNYYLSLNSNSSQTSSSNWLVSSATTLQLNQTFGNANTSGREYITYNFKSKPGFSKVGTYTGNGNASGPIVQTGFEPAFLMTKRSSSSGDWHIWDDKRSTSNPRNNVLRPNSANAETTNSTNNVSFYPNGFQLTAADSSINGSGSTYIYLAFAADPSTTTPSLANSFSTITYSGNGGTQSTNSLSNQAGTIGFAPDLTWIKTRSNTDGTFGFDTLRGAQEILMPTFIYSQFNRTGLTAFNSNGFTLGNYAGTNTNSYTYGSWNFKGGGSTPSVNGNGTITSLTTTNQAAGFSIVKWTSPGNSNPSNVGHGLSNAPELIFYKGIDYADNWYVYSQTTGLNKYLNLNTDAAVIPNNNNGFTNVNSSTFTTNLNNGSNPTLSYCFTSIQGYSKVGTYTWSVQSNTAGTMVTGLGFTPGLVIIKRTNGIGNWFIFDNKRVSGTQSYALYLNSSSAEVSTGYQGIILDADGFSAGAGADGNVTGSQGLNENGGTYIYLAIKEN